MIALPLKPREVNAIAAAADRLEGALQGGDREENESRGIRSGAPVRIAEVTRQEVSRSIAEVKRDAQALKVERGEFEGENQR